MQCLSGRSPTARCQMTGQACRTHGVHAAVGAAIVIYTGAVPTGIAVTRVFLWKTIDRRRPAVPAPRRQIADTGSGGGGPT
jgi:hypothetical protein